jgi:hypothetical protein
MVADVLHSLVNHGLIRDRVGGEDLNEVCPDHDYIRRRYRSRSSRTRSQKRSGAEEVPPEEVLSEENIFNGFETVLTPCLLKRGEEVVLRAFQQEFSAFFFRRGTGGSRDLLQDLLCLLVSPFDF